MGIVTKRVYEPVAPADGFRLLVDRLWPRNLSREKAAIDAWLKEVAPSTQLRKWFGHDPAKWESFRKRYAGELAASGGLDELRELIKPHRKVTLLYGARETTYNHANLLREWLEKGGSKTG